MAIAWPSLLPRMIRLNDVSMQLDPVPWHAGLASNEEHLLEGGLGIIGEDGHRWTSLLPAMDK